MFLYFLKVTICWLVFYLVYAKFLSKETFFKTNRWYLLGTLLLGAGIPLLEFLPIFQEDNPVVVYFQPISEGSFYVQSAVSEAVVNDFMNWNKLFFGIYLIGVAVCSIRFSIGLGKIYALFRKSEIIKKENHTLVLTNEPHLPFSFSKYMFWRKDLEMNDVDGQKIVTHEVAHVKGWHSIDVILLEIFNIIFWVSPMVYFYKKSLKTVHEYLADAVVLQTTPTKKYGHLLLRQSQSGLQIALANHFFHSQLKQRIVMMTRSKSRKEAIVKYLFALPVILLLLIAFSKKEAIANMNTTTTEIISSQDFDKEKVKSDFENLATIYQNTNFDLKANQDKFLKDYSDILFSLNGQYPEYKYEIDEIGRSVLGKSRLPLITSFERFVAFKNKPIDIKNNTDIDEMPRFPGCEEMVEIEKRNKCAQNKLLTFIYTNIKYPAEARKAGIQGKVIVKYVVQKDGTIAKARVAREIGGGCGDAALKVVNALPKMIPGMKDGKSVDVEMTIPVVFKLEGDNKRAAQPTKEKVVKEKLTNATEQITVVGFAPKVEKSTDGEVYNVVEEMPRFKSDDCEKMEVYQEQKKCAEQAMLNYIYSNIKYPAEARKAGIQGRAIIKFKVQKNGSIADAKILRNPGGGTGEEAQRVVNSMPNFVPGKQKGKAVNVYYTLPVSFKLAGSAPKADVMIEDNNIKLNKDMKPLFIVDGVEFDKSTAGELKSDEIATVNVLKGEKATEKYGDKGKNGVVEITLKNKKGSTRIDSDAKTKNGGIDSYMEGKDKNPLYVLDEKIVDKKVVDDLNPDEIATINVLKGEKYGDKGKDGVVEIITKNYAQKFNLENIEKKEVTKNDLKLSYVKISPNPTNGKINIEYGSQDKPMTITILDLNGKEIFSEKMAGGRSSLQDVDVSKAAKGILLVSFFQDGKTYTEKVILQ
ncbi:MAG: TonB family protein [Saprospiraceae bacterium]